MITRVTRRRDDREVIASLAAGGADFFTLGDLRDRFELHPAQAHQLAHRLARKGFVRRVKRGLFAILPPADWHTGGLGTDHYWTAAATVVGEPYYFAYYTAMEFHQMTQQPLRTLFVATVKPHRQVTFADTRVRFITLPAEKAFGHEDRRTAGDHIVQVAQLERAFLDCADRPELCGGIGEVFRGFTRRRNELDGDRLIRIVQRFDRPVATKRLGFLLEAAGGDPELLDDLERVAGRLKRYTPLDRNARVRTGTRNRRWELTVNADMRQLRAGART